MSFNNSAYEQLIVLMRKINQGIDEVKARSINNIYTKLKASIISNEMIT